MKAIQLTRQHSAGAFRLLTRLTSPVVPTGINPGSGVPMTTKVTSAFLTFTALTLALCACGAASTKSVAASSATVATTSTSLGTTKAAPITSSPASSTANGRTVSLTATFTDPAGYAFTITSRTTIGTPTIGDSTQLPPADTLLLLPVSSTASVRNTTPGARDSTYNPGDRSDVVALYKQPSPVCPTVLSYDPYNLNVNGASYCGVRLVEFNESTETGGIPAGQTVVLTPTVQNCNNPDNLTAQCTTQTNTPTDALIEYTATHSPAALTALTGAPALVVLTGQAGNQPANACWPDHGSVWIIAASQPLTSC